MKILKRFLRQALTDLKYIFHTPSFSSLTPDYEAYWKARSNNTLNSFQQFRADWILKHIDPKHSILDIAAGTGAMQKYFIKQGYENLIALENSEYCIACLKDINVKVIESSIDDIEAVKALPNSDVIILSEILEHLPNPEDTLNILKTKANLGVIFSFPNTGYYAERLRILFGKFPVQWRIHPGEHLRFWTHADLKNWLHCLGLSDKATITIYEGLPVLNKLLPSLFGKAFIVHIKTN